MLKIGLLINPVAGLGGAVALKGSDGVVAQALQRGARPQSEARVARALRSLGDAAGECRWSTWRGGMGEDCLAGAAIAARVVGGSQLPTSAADTRAAARGLVDDGVDLLVFAGGDGTARDILGSVAQEVPVLGIPAGVKMHSGVFASTPEQAGALLVRLIRGGLVQSVVRDVRDMDEAALRAGVLQPEFHGELRVPELGGYLQHTKESGRESEALAIGEIVAEIQQRLVGVRRPVVLCPGSTVGAVKAALGMEASLLGVDVWQEGRQLGKDVTASWLEQHVQQPLLILSFTRGQGFLLGRGNQQLSATLLRELAHPDLWIVGTRTKLASLDGRPLLIDTNEPDLDQAMAGLYEVITGYEDCMLYRVDSHA